MNKPATKGDVVFWALLILGSTAKTDTLAWIFMAFAIIALIQNTWFSKA